MADLCATKTRRYTSSDLCQNWRKYFIPQPGIFCDRISVQISMFYMTAEYLTFELEFRFQSNILTLPAFFKGCDEHGVAVGVRNPSW